MEIFLYILGGIVGFIIFIVVVSRGAKKRKRKRLHADISTWEIGDNLKVISYNPDYMELAKQNGQDYPKLWKWDEHGVIIDVGNGDTRYLIGHDDIKRNITNIWRNRYKRMNKFMDKIGKSKKVENPWSDK